MPSQRTDKPLLPPPPPGRLPCGAEPFSPRGRIGSITATVTTKPSATPSLLTLRPRGAIRGVALLALGGRSRSRAPSGVAQPTALRMYPFLLDLHRAGRGHGLAACQLRYRVRGYND